MDIESLSSNLVESAYYDENSEGENMEDCEWKDNYDDEKKFWQTAKDKI